MGQHCPPPLDDLLCGERTIGHYVGLWALLLLGLLALSSRGADCWLDWPGPSSGTGRLVLVLFPTTMLLDWLWGEVLVRQR